MSNAPQALLPTQALDLAVRLQDYRDTCLGLVLDRTDRDLYVRVRNDMRAMGERAAMLPAIWVPWGAVAVLHFKLMHPRWRNGEGDRETLAALVHEHDSLVEALRCRCVSWAVSQADAWRPGVQPAVLQAFSAWDKACRQLHEADRESAERGAAAGVAAGDGPAAGLRRQADELLAAARATLAGASPVGQA